MTTLYLFQTKLITHIKVYAVTKLSPAIMICPITRLANILTAKLIGLMMTLMSSTGTSNTHIKW